MLDLIKRLPGLLCLTHQVAPNEKGSGDVIADNTRETTLAFFQPRQLFRFTMKTFNLPANIARLSHDEHIRKSTKRILDNLR